MPQVCTIVGAGPGMGMALAGRFQRAGFTVALISRSADHLLADPAAAGMHAFQADAGEPQALTAAFKQIHQQLGGTEVLIYNAAAMVEASPLTLTPNMLIDHLRVNVVGALVSTQQVVPEMKIKGAGTLLFTGGGLSLKPRPQYASLAMGKAALRNLVGGLAGELTALGIKVGTVTINGWVNKAKGLDPDLIAEEYWTLHTAPPSITDYEIIYPSLN